jgi:hypothetical protein
MVQTYARSSSPDGEKPDVTPTGEEDEDEPPEES